MSLLLLRQAFIAFVAYALMTATVAAETPTVKDAEAAYDRGLYAEALRIARPLAKRGDPSAQHLLSLMYDLGRGVEQDFCEGTRWADKAARQGNPGGQYSMAWSHFSGLGIPRNNSMAYRWALAAKRSGDKRVAADLEMFGSGLSEQQRQEIRATMKSWRPKDQPPVKITRPPKNWLGRLLWRMRGRRSCK